VGGPSPAAAAVRRAVRSALPPDRDALVLVACSGGPDSLSLAAATAHEAARAGVRAGAVVVDHGLQPGSDAVAAVAARACRELGLGPVEVVRVAVGTAGGPEAAAREARYAALDAAADRLGAALVLLGHTLDDQAEQVLLGLARGSGARSLAGMPAARGRYRRPLLGVARAVVRDALGDLGAHAWDDPSNTDRTTARARVRHDLLPALEAGLGPGVTAALARSADLLREDADALDALAAEVVEGLPALADGVAAEALASHPDAVRRRALRLLLVRGGCPAGSLTRDHVLAADALVVRWRGQGAVALPGGARAVRSSGMLSLVPPPGRGRDADLPTP
jgi:tRNA(Ile)-lysidine synthase